MPAAGYNEPWRFAQTSRLIPIPVSGWDHIVKLKSCLVIEPSRLSSIGLPRPVPISILTIARFVAKVNYPVADFGSVMFLIDALSGRSITLVFLAWDRFSALRLTARRNSS